MAAVVPVEPPDEASKGESACGGGGGGDAPDAVAVLVPDAAVPDDSVLDVARSCASVVSSDCNWASSDDVLSLDASESLAALDVVPTADAVDEEPPGGGPGGGSPGGGAPATGAAEDPSSETAVPAPELPLVWICDRTARKPDKAELVVGSMEVALESASAESDVSVADVRESVVEVLLLA